MTFIEFFKQQFIEEAATTRKMLARVPDDKFDYKPHPKSMDMKRLATHIADLPGWIHMTLTTDEIDFAQPYEQPVINTREDLMAYFEKRYEDGLGVTRAITRALELYKAASDRHEFFSHIYLGRIYATGKGGVSRDERAALVYYGRAAAEAEHLVDCPEIHEAIAYVEAHRS